MVPVRRGRGRPRKAPEDHLKKLSGKVSKKETKTLLNNAASIRYRHKKASEFESLKQLYAKEKLRNEYLQRKAKKLEDSLKQTMVIENFCYSNRLP